MRILGKVLTGCVLLGLGYIVGITSSPVNQRLQAQEAGTVGPSQESQKKIQEANDGLKSAMLALEQENLYTPAIRGVNAFAVTVGGVNALEDLESGRGVDPETFAGLYAGEAIEEVADWLEKDDQGRLMYKNKVVRLYPISKLQELFARRKLLSGETEQSPF